MAFSDVIARLAVSLSLDTAAFTTGSRKAQAEATGLQARMAGLGKGIAGVGIAMGGVLAAAGLSNLIGQAVQMASALSEDAEKMGVTVEALQELRLAANQNGVANEALASSFAKMSKSIGQAEQGSKSVGAALASIGLSVDDLRGKAPEQQFALIADGLKSTADQNIRAAAGAVLLGKGVAELNPLINQGSAGLQKYAEQSRAQGEVSTESAKNLDDLADHWDSFKTALLAATANVVAGLIPVAQRIGAFLDRTRATMAGVHDAIVTMVKGVATWITGRLTAIWDGAKAKIDAVKGWFHGLYDAVIGHSYIPDMVDGIAAEMARLDAVMVAPVDKATTKAQQAFREMAGEIRGVLDRLFPDDAAALQRNAERSILGNIGDPAQRDRALRALANEQDTARLNGMPGLDFGQTEMGPAIDRILEQLDRFGKKATETSVRVAKSFKDMAQDTLSSLDKLASAIKGGGFLDILGAAIGFGLQLAGTGVFGSKIAARVNKTVPAYAAGTSFHPGGLALVGERGPELVSLPRGSSVRPNNANWGRSAPVEIRPSPYFDAVVDGRVVRATPGIMSGGAQVAQSQFARAQSRRLA